MRIAEVDLQAGVDAYDNALAENFFSVLKVEPVYRTTYRTRKEAELDVFRLIDGWYNPRRIQRQRSSGRVLVMVLFGVASPS